MTTHGDLRTVCDARGRLVCTQLVVVAIASILAAPASLTAQECQWSQIPGGPPGGRYHKMVYDSARDVVVMFYGTDDMWEWDGSTWEHVTAVGPTYRINYAVAYDSARGVTVLFGGYTGLRWTQETWEWDGSEWRLVANSGPSPRRSHAMAYDSVRGVVVLYGGFDDRYVRNGETWEWDGADWTLATALGPGPGPRSSHTMVFDERRAQTVLFGGSNPSAVSCGA